jgi:raffinose synthase
MGRCLPGQGLLLVHVPKLRLPPLCCWAKPPQPRTAGEVMQVLFLLFYQYIVDPAGPNTWPVAIFKRIATGPFKGSLLNFFAVSGDFTKRIISVQANGKFSRPDATADDDRWFAEAEDFRTVTSHLRRTFGVQYILCWHGLPAYWGGVMPESPEFEELRPSRIYPVPTPGLAEIEPAMLWNPAVVAGIGVVEDSAELYARMHKYLAASGVDGVKVHSAPFPQFCETSLPLCCDCRGSWSL